MTDNGPADDLIVEIGQVILQDEAYRNADWDGLALVATISGGERGYTGYIYDGPEWKPMTPESTRPLSRKLMDLQEQTRAPSGETWKQALIHITRPGPEINIQFEYDDPKRWSLKEVGLDMSDYAESLRPPRG